MRSIGIIPARFQSSRFPGKPLSIINGKSMIQRVYEQSKKCTALDHVCVATDDQRIIDEVLSFGGDAVMTSDQHQSGTDRCLEALNSFDQEFDVVVNIQGDEPYIEPEQIQLILSCFNDENTEIATLVKLIETKFELFDHNRPKVVVDSNDFAIFFSRQVIPYLRDQDKSNWHEKYNYYKHIGMYAFRKETLKEISGLKTSRLEMAEGLEQLRWLENGFKIKTAITEIESFAIDTPEDLAELLKL